MNEIKWGIIGCGDVTEKKSGPALYKITGSKLVAVMRRNKEKAADYARRHHVPKYYDNADQLINDPEVNAIYIATPPSSHKEYTLKAAAAGKPVYVEKPMALNHKECLEMIDACEKANVKLFVAYYRRRLPNFLKIKELIDSGIIGNIQKVNLQLHLPIDVSKMEPTWRVTPEISGGGIFYDLAPHQLDILDYFFGPIKIDSIKGSAKNLAGKYAAEDTVSADFSFESGVIANGSWNFTADQNGSKDVCEIIGSKGRIEFATFDKIPVKLFLNDETKEFSFTWPEHIEMPFIQTIVEELLGRGKCPSTPRTAARTNLVMDKIIKG